MAARAWLVRVRALAVGAVLAMLLVAVSAPSFASQSVKYPPLPAVPGNDCLGFKKPPSPVAFGEAARIVQHIWTEHPGDIQSVGSCPDGVMLVRLMPGREWLARQLQSHYGSEVAIFVGLVAWHGRPGRSPVCGTLPPVPDLRHGVALTLRLKGPTVISGDDFAGTVTLTNESSSKFATNIGLPLEAVLVRAGSRRVVGVYAGGIAGVGLVVKLERGGSQSIPFVGGTARCDGGTGSALPAGYYDVAVLVMDECVCFTGESAFSAYVRSSHPLRVLNS